MAEEVPQELWSHPDQDQNDDSLPHCCGVCQDGPFNEDENTGLI